MHTFITAFAPSSLSSLAAICSYGGKNVPCGDASSLMLLNIPIIIFSIALAILMLVSMWKVFEKAGKPGWAAIVPVYSSIVLLQIVGLSPWLVLLAFIPFFSGIAVLILHVLYAQRLSARFGKSNGFAFGLFFLPFVFYPILGFGDSVYTNYSEPQTPASPIPPPSSAIPPSEGAGGTKVV
ncbi:MAG: DUF5684 domain-containing protein [Candidatus Pacebacteria bacterium]|nr:DUF5684 domain-containing protein [Candidatus Paceibacterota bacterium]